MSTKKTKNVTESKSLADCVVALTAAVESLTRRFDDIESRLPKTKTKQRGRRLSSRERDNRMKAVEIEILGILKDQMIGDELTTNDLTPRLGRRRDSVSAAMKNLLSIGYVTRPRRADGYRAYRITTKGHTYWDRNHEKYKFWMKE